MNSATDLGKPSSSEFRAVKDSGRQQLRIVLMEDSMVQLRTTKRILVEAGFEVLSVHSAEEAADIAASRVVDLFILDIDMGAGRNQEGLAALEKIKKLDSRHFVALLTSHADRYEFRAKRLKRDTFVAKSNNKRNDLIQILRDFAARESTLFSNLESALTSVQHAPLNDIAKTSPNDGAVPRDNTALIDRDSDFEFYLALTSDPNWVREHTGKVVAISAATIIGFFESEPDACSALMKLAPEVSKFFMSVNDEIPVIDLGGILELD